jgi:tripartite-type tricarboxylate transporter receptor subunit TctC
MKSALGTALLAAALVAANGAGAQSEAPAYPTKSVRVIVPNIPGDTCDILMRVIGPRLSERLGQQFVVDNRVGGSGIVGHSLMAKAQPDGYTLGCANGGGLAIVPHAFKSVPYDSLKDFTPIALIAANFMALAVGGNSSARTVADLIQQAKQNPGKVTFGSNGEGGFLHFATELFRSQAGFTYLHVPFKGFPQMTTELVAGRLDAGFGSFTAVLPFTQGGRVRILGIGRVKRLPNYPDIPTISETVPGYTSGGWFGVVGPAGLPRPIATLVNREVNAVLTLPEIRDKLVAQGLDVYAEPPEYFAKLIRDDFTRYGKIAKEIGLQPQ